MLLLGIIYNIILQVMFISGDQSLPESVYLKIFSTYNTRELKFTCRPVRPSNIFHEKNQLCLNFKNSKKHSIVYRK